ncbi:MAG: capsular biosynthesis protein [Spirochaetales bacterium]|nr:capsular biosynthesis protein [Spirochaetales bacterium]
MATALVLRGIRPAFLICDGSLAACEATLLQNVNLPKFLADGPPGDLCSGCKQCANCLQVPGIQVYRYSDFLLFGDSAAISGVCETLDFADWRAIRQFQYEGLAVGEHAVAGAMRFMASGDLDEAQPRLLERYFRAALQTYQSFSRVAGLLRPEVVVFHHGIYIPQGVIGEYARSKNIRVVNYNVAYRMQRFIFSHETTYHHTLMSEPQEQWSEMHLTEGQEKNLMDYLLSRWHGSFDWIKFHEKAEADLSTIARDLGIDFNRPTIGLLTNVAWDAQLHYPTNAFENMFDWLVKTVEYFANRPEIGLLIRVHPAELKGVVSRQTVSSELSRRFQTLPPNVYLVGPESPFSTYALMNACNSVIIYGTKMGVELTSLGIPVIVAGEAWIRNKGITIDARSEADYFQILDSLPVKERLSAEKIRRARKYAYHFFFRRMIPIKSVEPTGKFPPFRPALQSLEDLKPGNDPGLDVILSGIVSGTPFVFDE